MDVVHAATSLVTDEMGTLTVRFVFFFPMQSVYLHYFFPLSLGLCLLGFNFNHTGLQ